MKNQPEQIRRRKSICLVCEKPADCPFLMCDDLILVIPEKCPQNKFGIFPIGCPPVEFELNGCGGDCGDKTNRQQAIGGARTVEQVIQAERDLLL